MALDVEVSRLVTLAHLLEFALDEREWFGMRYGDMTVETTREFTEDSIIFRADYPEHCWLTRPDSVQLLRWIDGMVGVQPVASKPIETQGDGAFTVEWEFRVSLVAVRA